MAEKEIQPEEEVQVKIKYKDVAPLVSKHIAFADIPIKEVSVKQPLAELTKGKVEEILASDNLQPTVLARKLNLSKGQVMKIRKEYQSAIRHKSYGGVE
jgi:hypothetical protein